MHRSSVLVGLVGSGIGASRSPQIHEREADAQDIRLIYRLFDLSQSPDALPSVLEAARILGFAGLNITHPFKQVVLPLLADLSVDACRIGSVNTIIPGPAGWIGHNTDGQGFADALRRVLPNADLSRVVQFGAGGAGAATADALLGLGVRELRLIDPDRDRAKALAERLKRSFPEATVMLGEVTDAVGGASGIVNASPIGMESYPGTAFDPMLLQPQQWVADIVYFPRETALLRAARQIGCATVDGSGMVVLQAARAFELFTGLNADRARMLEAFERP